MPCPCRMLICLMGLLLNINQNPYMQIIILKEQKKNKLFEKKNYVSSKKYTNLHFNVTIQYYSQWLNVMSIFQLKLQKSKSILIKKMSFFKKKLFLTLMMFKHHF